METLEPNAIQIAVTGIPKENEENAASWTFDFFKEIEKQHATKVKFQAVPLTDPGAWQLKIKLM